MRRRAPLGRIAASFTLIVLALGLGPSSSAAGGLPADWQRGASLTSWKADEYGTPESDASLEALRQTGANSVAIVPTWYMQDEHSTTIAPASNSPADAGVMHAMATAKSLGLRVVLKPHVDVPGVWRGSIEPDDAEAWFASYRAFIDHYADMAAAAGADVFVTGTEYASMIGYEGQWRRVIADVRARFHGRLTFAANLVDDAELIDFWDALDYVGVDAYMPLSDSDPNPTVAALVDAWRARGYVARLRALSERFGKPVIFPEIGYYPHLGTATAPNQVQWAAPVSADAQQRAYEAFYEVFSGEPWFKGVYWWDWPAVYEDTADYTPRGLPAQRTMEAWNAAPVSSRVAVGRPSVVREAGLGPALTLQIQRGRRGVVIRGGLSGGRACDGAVTAVLRRAGRRERTIERPLAAGRYSLAVRLPAGRYRARARAASACGRARSRRVAFRVRRR